MAKFQDETTFQEMETWLRDWRDPRISGEQPSNDEDVGRRFDRIFFDRVPIDDPKYGIPWSAELIEKTFDRLLHEKGTMEWHPSGPFHCPRFIALDSGKFDLPIQAKMDCDGCFYEDGGPLTLRRNGTRLCRV